MRRENRATLAGVSLPAVLALALALTLPLTFPRAATGSATTVHQHTLKGTEVPPISSTLGTFVGVATGGLPATWRVQIAHQPLATGPTVAITGGTFSLLTARGHKVGGPVSSGSVTVTNRGAHCTDQTYQVTLAFGSGSFAGTLTHHRHSILGRCILYSATIRGLGSFTT